jgi:hypothetical protein
MPFCSEVVQATMVLAVLAAPCLRAENSTGEPASLPAPGPRAVLVVRVDPHTGRLVRAVVVKRDGREPPLAATPEVRALVEETAKNLDVSPLLVESVIQVESGYNPYAISPKGAQGLMQLMPATARRFGVNNAFDARQNVEGGVRYLKFLQETFQDDRLAIAAYNAGEKAVAKYGDVPPYAETIGYVAKVGRKYGEAKRAANKSATSAKNAEQTKPAEDEPRHVVGYLDQEGRLHIATR